MEKFKIGDRVKYINEGIKLFVIPPGDDWDGKEELIVSKYHIEILDLLYLNNGKYFVYENEIKLAEITNWRDKIEN